MINVLHHAMRLVGVVHPNMTMTCRRYKSHTVNEMGVVQPVYEEFEAVGQFQPNAASASPNQLNIEVAKLGRNVWIKAELHTVETQPVADQIIKDGKTYNVMTVTDWNPGNGWGCYVVTEEQYGELKKEEEGGEEEDSTDSETESETEGGLEW